MVQTIQKDPSELKFECSKCGKISRENVLFLCNTCKQEELVERDGLYMCPSCLKGKENFECSLCGSKEVKLLSKIPQKSV